MTQSTVQSSPVTIGLDVGDRITHYCVLDAARSVVARGSFRTTQTALSKTLNDFSGARVALEAGSQSPWMSRHLRGEGFDTHVVDPRRVQLISKDPRKTDRRDAEVLARFEAGMPELLGTVHHRGEQAQADLSIVRARDLLVRMRAMVVQQVRSLSKAFGVRLPSASTSGFPKRARDLAPSLLQPAVGPLLDQVDELTLRIRVFWQTTSLATTAPAPHQERRDILTRDGSSAAHLDAQPSPRYGARKPERTGLKATDRVFGRDTRARKITTNGREMTKVSSTAESTDNNVRCGR